MNKRFGQVSSQTGNYKIRAFRERLRHIRRRFLEWCYLRYMRSGYPRLHYLFFYRWRQVEPLTGIFDRRKFVLDLDRALRTSDQRVAVLYANMDLYRCVNDTYGVRVGDKVLRAVAQLFLTRCKTVTGVPGLRATNLPCS